VLYADNTICYNTFLILEPGLRHQRLVFSVAFDVGPYERAKREHLEIIIACVIQGGLGQCAAYAFALEFLRHFGVRKDDKRSLTLIQCNSERITFYDLKAMMCFVVDDVCQSETSEVK
jgi:hypothetical protein